MPALQQGLAQLRLQRTSVMQSLLAVQLWEMPEEADAGAPALLEEREAGEHVSALQQEVAHLRLQLTVRRSASRRGHPGYCFHAHNACAQEPHCSLSSIPRIRVLPRAETSLVRALA